jgi:hypothetical protein
VTGAAEAHIATARREAALRALAAEKAWSGGGAMRVVTLPVRCGESLLLHRSRSVCAGLVANALALDDDVT